VLVHELARCFLYPETDAELASRSVFFGRIQTVYAHVLAIQNVVKPVGADEAVVYLRSRTAQTACVTGSAASSFIRVVVVYAVVAAEALVEQHQRIRAAEAIGDRRASAGLARFVAPEAVGCLGNERSLRAACHARAVRTHEHACEASRALLCSRADALCALRMARHARICGLFVEVSVDADLLAEVVRPQEPVTEALCAVEEACLDAGLAVHVAKHADRAWVRRVLVRTSRLAAEVGLEVQVWDAGEAREV
jgi:hypothetical protein